MSHWNNEDDHKALYDNTPNSNQNDDNEDDENWQTMLFIDNKQQYRIRLPVSLAKRINKQREQIDKFKMEIAKGYSKQEDFRQQISKLRQEKEHLTHTLNDKTYDLEVKTAQLQSMQTTIEQHRAQTKQAMEKLVKENQEYKQEKELLENSKEILTQSTSLQNRSLQDKVEFYEKEYNNLKHTKETQTKEITDLRVKVTHYEHSNEQLKATIQQKNGKIEEINKNINQIQTESQLEINNIRENYENEKREHLLEKQEKQTILHELQLLKQEKETLIKENQRIEKEKNLQLQHEREIQLAKEKENLEKLQAVQLELKLKEEKKDDDTKINSDTSTENEIDEYIGLIMDGIGFDDKLKFQDSKTQEEIISFMFDAFNLLDDKKVATLIGIINHCTIMGNYNNSGKRGGYGRKHKHGISNIKSPTMKDKYINLNEMGLILLYKMQHFVKEFDEFNPDLRLELINRAITNRLKNWQEWTYEQVIEFLLTIRHKRSGNFVCEPYEEKLRRDSKTIANTINNSMNDLPILALVNDDERLKDDFGITKKQDRIAIMKAINVVTKGKNVGDVVTILQFTDDDDDVLGEAAKAAPPAYETPARPVDPNSTGSGVTGSSGGSSYGSGGSGNSYGITGAKRNNGNVSGNGNVAPEGRIMFNVRKGGNTDDVSDLINGPAKPFDPDNDPRLKEYNQMKQSQADVKAFGHFGHGGYNPYMDPKNGKIQPIHQSGHSLINNNNTNNNNNSNNQNRNEKGKEKDNSTQAIMTTTPISPISKNGAAKSNGVSVNGVKNEFIFGTEQKHQDLKQKQKQKQKQNKIGKKNQVVATGSRAQHGKFSHSVVGSEKDKRLFGNSGSSMQRRRPKSPNNVAIGGYSRQPGSSSSPKNQSLSQQQQAHGVSKPNNNPKSQDK